MNLKTKYFIYVTLIHVVLITFSIIFYFHNKVLFVACEALVLLSLVLCTFFYRSVFRPFKLLNAGVESISDKDFSMKFLPVGQPELDRLIEVFNKMIDQLRLERTKTTEKNFFLEKLIDASPAGIIILDKNGLIQSVNSSAKSMLESDSEHQPKKIEELPAPWNTALQNLDEKNSIVIQINGINQYKCYKSYFIDKGIKQSFYIIEELTKELLKAERQSYDKVIRMMSHEVNNSVGAVNSIIDSSVSYMQKLKDEGIIEYIKVMNIARERIINLNYFTKRFAEIVEIPQPNLSECNIREIIERVLIYFKTDFEQNKIRVTTRFSRSNNTVLFDYQQLEMVLVNIIRNAAQAIDKNGNINILFSEKPQILVIENDGEPIPEEIQKKLFKPFFTTKKTGQGIGLTLIREILTNHACEFSLSTRKDAKTEFRIIFPPDLSTFN